MTNDTNNITGQDRERNEGVPAMTVLELAQRLAKSELPASADGSNPYYDHRHHFRPLSAHPGPEELRAMMHESGHDFGPLAYPPREPVSLNARIPFALLIEKTYGARTREHLSELVAEYDAGTFSAEQQSALDLILQQIDQTQQ